MTDRRRLIDELDAIIAHARNALDGLDAGDLDEMSAQVRALASRVRRLNYDTILAASARRDPEPLGETPTRERSAERRN